MSDLAGLVREPVTVRVPASSANLGPGFDSLGLALTLHDVLTASVHDGACVVDVAGEGAGSVPGDGRNLVARSARRGFEALGVEPPGLRLRCENAVPHGRGLGSSSAAIVGGLLLARSLVVDGAERLPDLALLALAARIEGHPDNVAPAVLGGLTVAWGSGSGSGEGSFSAVRLDVAPALRAVAFVPPDAVATKVARDLLPKSVPHADAAANAGRAALLVAALTGQLGGEAGAGLFDGTADWLHQQYRAPAMPESAALVGRLREQGVAAFVSGAGPTVLALTVETGGLLDSMGVPDGWRVLPLEVDRTGAAVV